MTLGAKCVKLLVDREGVPWKEVKRMNAQMRPYELIGPKYALWSDCGELGINIQTAVESYLLGESIKIKPPFGTLDERSKAMIKKFARQRGVLIPDNAF